MISGLIFHKVGMTRIPDENGNFVPATVLRLDGGVIVGVRQINGEKRVILSFDRAKEKNVPKPIIGILRKAGVNDTFKILKEFKLLGSTEVSPGQKIRVDIFSVGEKVDVIGVSKGKGFQGAMKRWGFAGGPDSHGSMSHRRVGAIGCRTDPGRVWKGKKMPGRMGYNKVTVKNLKILYVDTDKELIAVKGSVPGWIGAKVIVRKKESR